MSLFGKKGRFVVFLKKTDNHRGVWQGLTGGSDSGSRFNCSVLQGQGGGQDDRTDIGIVSRMRWRDTDRGSPALVGVNGIEAKIGRGIRQPGSSKFKITIGVTEGKIENPGGREFNQRIRGGVTEKPGSSTAEADGDLG